WTFATRAIAGPEKPVEVHLPELHFFIPGVIGDVFRLSVRTQHDGIMAGADDMAGHRAQDAWSGLVAHVGIRSHHIQRDAIIHAVIFRLPAAGAVEAVIMSLMLADARAFQRVPIPNAAIHQAVFLKSL